MRQAETAPGWPARAGKLVLGIALDRVADYFSIRWGPIAGPGMAPDAVTFVTLVDRAGFGTLLLVRLRIGGALGAAMGRAIAEFTPPCLMLLQRRVAKVVGALAGAAVAAHGHLLVHINEARGDILRSSPPNGGTNTMILYGSTMSPFVRKVAAYAAEKGLEIELKQTGFPDHSPEFLAASPFRKMPALEDGDYRLADSSAIIHYLEAQYPEPELIPADPRERGRVIWFDEFADTILFACGAKIFFNRVVAPRFLGRDGDLGIAEAAERDELPPLLDYLESVISDSGFLVGDRLTLADIAVAGPFANFGHCKVKVDEARYPKTIAYTTRILARPSFAQHVDREAAYLARVPA